MYGSRVLDIGYKVDDYRGRDSGLRVANQKGWNLGCELRSRGWNSG